MNDAEKIPSELVGFKEEIANIQTAIADFESGQKLNIAITAEPFVGRTTLVNVIEKMNPQKVTRVSFSSIIKNKDEIALPEQLKRIVVLDDCQFLYMRKIRGFDVLEDLLKLVASSNNLFITTWNFYSWNYLDEVMNIGKFFPIQIKLPKLTTSEIKEVIISKYKTDEIKFVEDVEFEKEKIVNFVKYQVTIKPLKKTINLPFLKIDYSSIKLLLKKEEKVSIEDIIFEKLNHISNGNPGVAKVVWDRSLEYPTIKPSKIKEFSYNIDLDYNESFILSIILSMNSIKKEELAEIAGFEIDRVLFRLVKQGLIAIDEEKCCIRPEALRSIVEYMKKSRLVW